MPNVLRTAQKTLALSLLALVFGIFPSIPAHAATATTDYLNVETLCAKSQANFTGLIELPIDSYDVYVRLAARGQSAHVTAYAQAYEDTAEMTCQKVGNVQASGNKWTKAGSWNASAESLGTIFQLSSNGLTNNLDANRPSVMLVPKSGAVCQPTTECYVDIDGAQGYVRPTGTLLNKDSLHVVRVTDPTSDTVKSVAYYVDNRPAYSSETLEPFDYRYVDYFNHKVSSVITYESGQIVVIDEQVPEDFHDSIFNMGFRFLHYNSGILTIGVWAAAIIFAWSIIIAIVHAVLRHRAWRIAHGFAHEMYESQNPAVVRRWQLWHKTTIITKRIFISTLLVVGVFTLIFSTNTYVISMYRVDGHSMDSTFETGQRVFINKIPVTAAHLNGTNFVPKRGQVAIFKAAYGLADRQSAEISQGEYLIKRVIGLPGERVVVKNGIITIFNKDNPEGFNPDEEGSWGSTMHASDEHENINITLGTDELFISGDNRPVSVDSRFNGPILSSQIVGIVIE